MFDHVVLVQLHCDCCLVGLDTGNIKKEEEKMRPPKHGKAIDAIGGIVVVFLWVALLAVGCFYLIVLLLLVLMFLLSFCV